MWSYIKFLLKDEGGWIGAAIGIGMLASAWLSSKSASRAASAQENAANAAAQAQLDMYYQTRADLAPWREAGAWALGEVQGMLEAGPGEYTESPYYNFLLEQGTRGLERGAAARGGQLSGAENQALIGYGQNLASTDYQNWLNNWYRSMDPYMNLAGYGQGAAGTGAQSGTGIANALLAQGQAQAAGELGTTAPWTNMLNWGGNQLLNYYMMSQMMGGGAGGYGYGMSPSSSPYYGAPY